MARAMLPLVVTPGAWIERRVEDVAISSPRLVRRSVTVDLVLPSNQDELRVDLADGSSPLVLPLGLLKKEQLIDFDLAEGSSSLMLVRSGLNAIVAGAIPEVIAAA